jgi:hypothetical protein
VREKHCWMAADSADKLKRTSCQVFHIPSYPLPSGHHSLLKKIMHHHECAPPRLPTGLPLHLHPPSSISTASSISTCKRWLPCVARWSGDGAVVGRAQVRRMRNWPLPGHATILSRRQARTGRSRPCSASSERTGEKHMLHAYVLSVLDVL